MNSTSHGRGVRAVLAGMRAAAASAALAPVVIGAVPAAPAGAAVSAHPPMVSDRGVLGCMALSRVHQVAAGQYPRIRAEFAASRWPELRLAGTAYVDLATALLRARHAYGGETVWFYERLSVACEERGHSLDDNA